MEINEVMELARKHEGANRSAAFCYNDALRCWYRDQNEAARRWALRSLEYSVGIFHADYKAASAN